MQVGHSEGLPDTLPDANEMDEALQKVLHHVLLEVCVCVCVTDIQYICIIYEFIVCVCVHICKCVCVCVCVVFVYTYMCVCACGVCVEGVHDCLVCAKSKTAQNNHQHYY